MFIQESKLMEKVQKYLKEQQSTSPIGPINGFQELMLKDIPSNTRYIEDENKKNKKNVANKAPVIKGYDNNNIDFFSSCSTGSTITEDLMMIPTTKTEEKILNHAGFRILEEAKTLIIKDKKSGNVRGAISIHQEEDEEDDDNDEDNDIDIDDAYDDIKDEHNEDEHIENEEIWYQQEKPKTTMIKYFDVDPSGKNAQQAITHLAQSPQGYCLTQHKIKIIKDDINYPFLKTFLY